MYLNKIILGMAQSDKRYGLSYNKDISDIHKVISNFGIKNIDTSPKYKNSHKISFVDNNFVSFALWYYRGNQKSGSAGNCTMLRPKFSHLSDILANPSSKFKISFLATKRPQ